mgnify:CR=1 FL=1
MLRELKMNFSELAKEDQDAWSETMLDHSYSWEEWMEARLTLLNDFELSHSTGRTLNHCIRGREPGSDGCEADQDAPQSY